MLRSVLKTIVKKLKIILFIEMLKILLFIILYAFHYFYIKYFFSFLINRTLIKNIQKIIILHLLKKLVKYNLIT